LFAGTVLVMTSSPTGNVAKTITQECWTNTQEESVKKARDLSKYLAKEVLPSYQLTALELQSDFETIQIFSQNLVESFTSKNPTFTQMNQSAQENKEIVSKSIAIITKIQSKLETKQGNIVIIRFVRQLKTVFEEVAKTATQTLECLS
ncbi:MAG: hypothetical protein Q7K43_01080, partial [Candidatus Woesearchaeota archaeon]|nr:hypothetical protein [Candidatus Woesearchaeota archaeon]